MAGNNKGQILLGIGVFCSLTFILFSQFMFVTEPIGTMTVKMQHTHADQETTKVSSLNNRLLKMQKVDTAERQLRHMTLAEAIFDNETKKFVRRLKKNTIEEIINNESKELNLVFFGASWCPHCYKFAKNLNKFTKGYKIGKYGGLNSLMQKVKFNFVDCVDDDEQTCSAKYEVRQFPTIRLYYGKTKQPYRGEFETPDKTNKQLYAWIRQKVKYIAKENDLKFDKIERKLQKKMDIHYTELKKELDSIGKEGLSH